MKTKRITLISSGLAAGGSELQLTQLVLGLQRRGWQPGVISLQSGGIYASRLVEGGVAVHELDVGRIAGPLRLIRLARTIRAARPSIVHTQAFRANLWGRLAAVLVRLPVVASVRATYSYLPRAYYPVERLLGASTASIVTPSRASSRFLVNPIGIPAAKVLTIPNGVDTGLFSPDVDGAALRRRWAIGDRIIILSPGRLVAQKNHAGLLRAFSIVAGRTPDSVLVIAGSGPLEGTLRAQAGSLGDRVLFVGELSRAEMAHAMAAADIVCLMSEFEGTPNAVLEAMAAGCAVVATAVDGVPEVIDAGGEGLLVPRGAVGLAADALTDLAHSPAKRALLGSRGRARVVTEHSIDVNVDRHIALYERVLAGRRDGVGEELLQAPLAMGDG